MVKRLGREFKLIMYSENIKVNPVVHRRCRAIKIGKKNKQNNVKLVERFKVDNILKLE